MRGGIGPFSPCWTELLAVLIKNRLAGSHTAQRYFLDARGHRPSVTKTSVVTLSPTVPPRHVPALHVSSLTHTVSLSCRVSSSKHFPAYYIMSSSQEACEAESQFYPYLGSGIETNRLYLVSDPSRLVMGAPCPRHALECSQV